VSESEREINISGAMKNDLLQTLASPSMFDKAQDIIIQTLNKNILVSFSGSEEGKELHRRLLPAEFLGEPCQILKVSESIVLSPSETDLVFFLFLFCCDNFNIFLQYQLNLSEVSEDNSDSISSTARLKLKLNLNKSNNIQNIARLSPKLRGKVKRKKDTGSTLLVVNSNENSRKNSIVLEEEQKDLEVSVCIL